MRNLADMQTFVPNRLLLCGFLFLFFFSSLISQSYRGLHVINDSMAWISGSKGTVLRTLDGGQSWDTLSPRGYAQKDFRDIHVFSTLIVLVMSSGDSAVVLRTEDGGKNWAEVIRDNRPGVFLDAMDFSGPHGLIIGDPLKAEDGSLYFDLRYSQDSGKSWGEWVTPWFPEPGEALFAASGTNIFLRYPVKDGVEFKSGRPEACFVTGGNKGKMYLHGRSIGTLLEQCESCGMYSLALSSDLNPVAVGGDYKRPDRREFTSVYFDKEKKSMKLSETMPGGYRSGVAFSGDENLLLCCGTNGADISRDGGKNWIPLNGLTGYNACQFSPHFVWLAGTKGTVTRIPLSQLK